MNEGCFVNVYLEIIDINELEVVEESSISNTVLWSSADVLQVAQSFVTPLVEGAEPRTGTSLSI